MGRNKKYLSDSAKKRGKLATARANKVKRIYPGKAFDAWLEAKETAGVKNDSSFAKILLDR